MKPSKYPSPCKVELSQNPTCRNRLPSLLKLAIVAIAALALSATLTHAQTNILVNPGFESGTSPWTSVPPWNWQALSSFCGVQSTNDYVYGSATEHVSVHGGANAMKIWGYDQPYTVADGLMQTLPCSAESTWAASGWLNTQNPDNMRSTEFAYLEVDFLDATTNLVGPAAYGESPSLTPASPTNTWTYLQVADALSGSTNLIAPAGTAFIRFIMRFSQPSGYPGGSCYYDDMQLVKTSKPDPEITVQPVPQTVVYGQTATFSVTADGLTTLSYQWQNNGANITDPNAYGVTTATLTLSNVTTAMEGDYSCTVSNQSGGALPSNPAYLTVNDPGVISITPPLGQTVTNGGSATMTVAAAGSSILTYAWQLNGNPLSGGHYSGINGSTLSISGVTTADAGTYTVLINGGAVQASSALSVVPASQLATNLLNNPGFEDGVLSEAWESFWIPFGGLALVTTNNFYYDAALAAPSTTPVSVYDGTYACEVYVSAPDNGVYQANVPAVAGATYHVGGHFYMSSLDPITSPAWVVLQLFFKDSGGNTLATLASPEIGPTFPADTWTFLQLSNATGGLDLVAPAGTASATCQIYEYAQIGGGGSVYFDDLYVTLALPPPFSITPSVAGGQINISFPTITGTIYEVLYTDNLQNPLSTWKTNATVTGDGTVKSVPDTLSAAARFYRVRAHNP